MADTPEGWESRGTQTTLFRRFAFERYGQTRDFIDAVSALTQASGIHPQNLNFGSTYANVTLDANAAGEVDTELAVSINALYRPAAA